MMRIDRLEVSSNPTESREIHPCVYRSISHSRIDDNHSIIGEKNVLIAIGNTSLIIPKYFCFRQIRMVLSDDE